MERALDNLPDLRNLNAEHLSDEQCRDLYQQLVCPVENRREACSFGLDFIRPELKGILGWYQLCPETPLGPPVVLRSELHNERLRGLWEHYCARLLCPPYFMQVDRHFKLHLQRNFLAIFWKEEREAGRTEPFPLGLLFPSSLRAEHPPQPSTSAAVLSWNPLPFRRQSSSNGSHAAPVPRQASKAPFSFRNSSALAAKPLTGPNARVEHVRPSEVSRIEHLEGASMQSHMSHQTRHLPPQPSTSAKPYHPDACFNPSPSPSDSQEGRKRKRQSDGSNSAKSFPTAQKASHSRSLADDSWPISQKKAVAVQSAVTQELLLSLLADFALVEDSSARQLVCRFVQERVCQPSLSSSMTDTGVPLVSLLLQCVQSDIPGVRHLGRTMHQQHPLSGLADQSTSALEEERSTLLDLLDTFLPVDDFAARNLVHQTAKNRLEIRRCLDPSRQPISSTRIALERILTEAIISDVYEVRRCGRVMYLKGDLY